MKKLLGFVLAFCITVSVNAQTVFKTPSGAKYHLSSCRMVKNVSQEISPDAARKLSPVKFAALPISMHQEFLSYIKRKGLAIPPSVKEKQNQVAGAGILPVRPSCTWALE